MSNPLRWIVPEATKDLQLKASNPASSAWVSAHAGSGKTFVLSQRVVRLLLEGVPPSKILCLTFTKAAAANMSLRVFDILSQWTRMDDEQLRRAIVAMGGDSSRLSLARRLFARAVETPGGLKIQTIHAFCERLLHSFPFEANVPAHFQVLTDDARKELLDSARQDILAEAVGNADSQLGQALRQVAALTTSKSFHDLLGQALFKRNLIAEVSCRPVAEYKRLLERALGAPGNESVEDIERDMMEGGFAFDSWEGLAQRLDRGGANDVKTGARIRAAIGAQDHLRLDKWLAVFFTDKGEPRAKMATKALDADPGLREALDEERDRLALRDEQRRAAIAVQRSAALALLANAIVTRYGRLKQVRGLLDFEDLVERTNSLMKRSDAAWVHCKLDAGVDHVLIDEAQDTSPDQWEILEALTSEFFVGSGARTLPRTFFAVGDEKQSIFSFQGAAPNAFAQQLRKFQRHAKESEKPFEPVRLQLSFRTAKGVLDEVDRLFSPADYSTGVVGPDDPWMPHEALKKDLAGLVELWPPIAASGAQPPEDWLMPLDRKDESDPAIAMSRRIADHVKALIAPGSREAVHEKNGSLRSVRAGDVLILVRKRGPFFEGVIRALKEAGVPVAGADRLKLGDHIAVQDLVAAGRIALLPQDDLTLACVLKSPLIGLNDDDLLKFAPRRRGALIDALRACPEPRSIDAMARIDSWRKRAGESPFRFYARLLGPEEGRAKFLARLGPEAGDAVDEFLKLALDAEVLEPPSLVAFLHRLGGADLSIRRDMEAAGETVRVMTVHAAKGLEAKIVYLPDTCGAASGAHDPGVLKLEGIDGTDLMVWRKGAKHDPPALAEALAQSRREEEEEHRRLLYVAMTRAEERLYICGFHGVSGPRPGCWYAMAQTMLAPPHLSPHPAPWDAAETLLRAGVAAQLADLFEETPEPEPAAPAPSWLHMPAPREAAPAPPISPSSALAAADQLEIAAPDPLAKGQGQSNADGRRIGTITHALLQYLPDVAPDERRPAALRYLAARARDLTLERREALCERALAVLDESALKTLFGPGSRAEVSIAANVSFNGQSRRVIGQIDRLAVIQNEIVIADFKSGAPRELDDIPAAYVAQLALYARAAGQLWPGRSVRAILVWTAGPASVELPETHLSAALDRLGMDGEHSPNSAP